ncbi:hypothetical protein G3S64_003943, partial [Escherichia coli]|nr:hypothetical protein [Escherichia coli]EFI4277888.1 hypothetical protein [Escherichia coli]EFI5390841.1 hypothetical protein [Escherichia coli]
EIMIWQPEFTDKILSRKPGAVHPTDIKISGEKNERSAHRIEQIRKSISRKYF